MNYLLDTHTLVWSIVFPEKLSQSVSKIFKAGEGAFWVSAISFWEISLKYAIGKLDIRKTTPDELFEYSLNAGFKVMDLEAKTAANFYKLARSKNKDPFDQML